jgi:hypothetical protein
VRNCYSSDVERSQDSEASLVGTSGGACCRCFVRGSRRYPSPARDNQHVARLTYSAGGCPGGEQRETEPAPGSGIFTRQACSRALAGSESTAPLNRPGGDGCARRRTCRYHGDEQVQAGRVGGCLARIRLAVDAQDVSRCGIGACDSALLGPACVLTTAGSGAPTPHGLDARPTVATLIIGTPGVRRIGPRRPRSRDLCPGDLAQLPVIHDLQRIDKDVCLCVRHLTLNEAYGGKDANLGDGRGRIPGEGRDCRD